MDRRALRREMTLVALAACVGCFALAELIAFVVR